MTSGNRSVSSSSPRDQMAVVSSAADELRPDAVPFPFDEVVRGVAEDGRDVRVVGEMLGRRVDGRREVKGVRAGDVLLGRLRGEHASEKLRGGSPLAHEAVRDQIGVDARRLRERAGDERRGDTHPQLARQQLDEEKRLPGVALREPGRQEPAAVDRIKPAEGFDPILDPHVQGRVIGGWGQHAGRAEHQGDGFGDVPHCRVALGDDPPRKRREVGEHRGEVGGGHEAAHAPAGKEEDGPGGVVGRRGGDVLGDRLHLGVGRSRLVDAVVEVGEETHANPPPRRRRCGAARR
jgi:hypothetical protein